MNEYFNLQQKQKSFLLLLCLGLMLQGQAFPFTFIKKKPSFDSRKAFLYQLNRAQVKNKQTARYSSQPNFDHFNYFKLPDYDKDGTPDKYDNCPSVTGVPERSGCPLIDITKLITFARPTIAIPESEFEASVHAFANLEFRNGKMTPSSAQDLDAFIKVMKRKRNWIISFSSYVDLGMDTNNMKVSEERLKQLRVYMIQKGISPKRIKGYSFGDMMPVVDLPLSRFEVEINY